MSIETVHLTLVPCAAEHILALMERPDQFETLAGFPVADGLREFYLSDDVSPTWLASLRSSVGPDPWRHGFWVVYRDTWTAIGGAGFKGPPDSAGMVEIAYGIVPALQGRGYATEAAAWLIAFALEHPEVQLLRAHTLPTPNASTRVLMKCGFHHTGEVIDPDDGRVWRWERTR